MLLRPCLACRASNQVRYISSLTPKRDVPILDLQMRLHSNCGLSSMYLMGKPAHRAAGSIAINKHICCAVALWNCHPPVGLPKPAAKASYTFKFLPPSTARLKQTCVHRISQLRSGPIYLQQSKHLKLHHFLPSPTAFPYPDTNIHSHNSLETLNVSRLPPPTTVRLRTHHRKDIWH